MTLGMKRQAIPPDAAQVHSSSALDMKKRKASQLKEAPLLALKEVYRSRKKLCVRMKPKEEQELRATMSSAGMTSLVDALKWWDVHVC